MTIKEIAQEAGVSMMTVSNVINKRYERVSQATVNKVTAIIDKYNYVPNLTARSLTAKSSHIVAVIVTSHKGEERLNFFENPYISALIGIIERELRHNGYFTMIRTVKNIDDVASLLRNWNCDGAIFLEPSFDDMMDELVGLSRTPLAFFDSCSNNPDIINVTIDDRKGGYLSAQYLINMGHRRIAFMGNHTISHIIRARYDGYLDALRANGIEPDDSIVYLNTPSYGDGILAGKELALRKGDVSAVVTTADFSAIGVMEGARLGGARVPIDLSVIGFDNLSVCTYTTPKLTSVSQNLTEKAAIAVAMLLNKMKGVDAGVRCEQLDVEVIERQSVASLI